MLAVFCVGVLAFSSTDMFLSVQALLLVLVQVFTALLARDKLP